jgi:hypothetical protein
MFFELFYFYENMDSNLDTLLFKYIFYELFVKLASPLKYNQ